MKETQEMKKINLVMLILIVFNISTVSAQEEDTFQQVINFLFLGDPHQGSFEQNSVKTTVKIFNRKDCIAGVEYSDGDTIEFHLMSRY